MVEIKTEKNIKWSPSKIENQERLAKQNHKASIIWLTGLSAAGKSTIAFEMERRLFDLGCNAYVLDGDNIRHGLNKDLGFSPDDRVENIRRIGEVAKLFASAGFIIITAFISPYRADRQIVRDMVEDGEFIEVHVDCPLEECERRDPKGLYKKARMGEIPEFTGISAPYEEPNECEIYFDTADSGLDDCVDKVVDHLAINSIIDIIPKEII